MAVEILATEEPVPICIGFVPPAPVSVFGPVAVCVV